MKLNKVQQDIIDKMKNGWELGSTSGGRGPSFHNLQKGGTGRGGETIEVNYKTIQALLARKIIKRIYGFPTSIYVLIAP